jgi:hypothetical protein
MKRIILALTLLLPSLASAADKPVHLFILTGQSNMAGMDPKLGFEPEGKKLFPEADVAYIKVAVGGMPIRYWVDEWDDIATKHGVDVAKAREKDKSKGTIFYPRVLEQFAQLLKQHPNPASVTFCWMQGENDSKTGLHAPYADALKQLIANLRRDLKRPDMNVVIGRISDIQVRDYALGSHNEETADAYWQMWRELLLIAPRGFVAPIASVYAALAYERGEGALAQRALDRAFADDEKYSLALLLRRVFTAGWPAQSFTAMRKELHPKVVAGIFG